MPERIAITVSIIALCFEQALERNDDPYFARVREVHTLEFWTFFVAAIGCVTLCATLAVVAKTQRATSPSARAEGRVNAEASKRLISHLKGLTFASLAVELSGVMLSIGGVFTAVSVTTLVCSLASFVTTLRKEFRSHAGEKRS